MTDIYYFKTQSPQVIEAHDDLTKALDRLRQDSEAIRDYFGAEKIVLRCRFPDTEFEGLIFTPPKDTATWTVPKSNNSYTQRPRLAKGMKKSLAIEQQKLVDEWIRRLPIRVSLTGILKSLGICWSQFIFGSSFSIRSHDGWIFIRSSVNPTIEVVEIMASEFNTLPE